MINIQPLYEIGDYVTIKDLETLKEELGDPIIAQCGWCSDMNKYAGGEYMIINRRYSDYRGAHYSYRLEGAGRWLFSEDTLERERPMLVNMAISYESAMGIS